MYIVDAHCDAPSWAYRGRNLALDNPDAQVDFPKMKRGGVSGAFFAVYVPASLSNDEAAEYAVAQLDAICSQVEANPDAVAFAVDAASMQMNASKGLISVFLGLENGSALLAGEKLLDEMYSRGVRYVTLCHSADNGLCDSCTGDGRWGGLSPEGRRMVHRMNSMGMTIDVAHTSNATVSDVLETSSRPVAYTHGCCSSLCSHRRNLPDGLIRRIADGGGVVCMSIYPCFLTDSFADFDEDHPDGRAMPPMSMVLDHIDHAIRIAGIEGVGLGTDFDGIGATAEGLENVSKTGLIFDGMRKRGYTWDEIEKVASENLLRVISAQ